jgi:hypothetical protein
LLPVAIQLHLLAHHVAGAEANAAGRLAGADGLHQVPVAHRIRAIELGQDAGLVL